MSRRITAFLVILVLLTLSLSGALAAYPTLRRGARGGEVSRLQSALKGLGLYSMAVDGVYGPGTEASVRAFQRAQGLSADGVAGPMTLTALYEGTSPSPEPEITPAPDDPTPAPTAAPTAAPAPVSYATLRPGARGGAVSDLQQALRRLGYYRMAVDGIYGGGTAEAVRAFQRGCGLTADGIAGPKTLTALYGSPVSPTETPSVTPAVTSQITPTPTPAPTPTPKPTATPAPTPAPEDYQTLRPGSRGALVSALQQALKDLGFYTLSVDGDYGPGTRSSVRAFQRAHNLSADGIAGPMTLSVLYAQAPSDPEQQTGLQKALHRLDAIVEESGVRNGAVVLSKDGQVFFTYSFGGADEDTCYRIASVTKWVTAIGLMTLYDEGRLDLDEDISSYLPFTVRNPAFPNVKITARMLLTHTSSLSPDASSYHPDWARIGKGGYDPLFNEKLRPGSAYAYADYNGALFGALIEAISGQGVQTFMNSRVFAPLGLTASYDPGRLPAGTKTKDLLAPNGRVQISVRSEISAGIRDYPDPAGNNGYTVGRLYINASSLTRLARMMLNGGELDGVRVLKEETVRLMEADQADLADSPYGLSTVRLSQFPRGVWYGHQGRYSGLSSNVYYQRETGITAAIIMNGYSYKLENNIVLPAVRILTEMSSLESFCFE